jgi:hypothetical protein
MSKSLKYIEDRRSVVRQGLLEKLKENMNYERGRSSTMHANFSAEL